MTLTSLAAHATGVVMTQVTIGFMRGMSPFALAVREHDLSHLPSFRLITFPTVTLAALVYLWPLLRYSLAGYRGPASALVQRRALGAPLVTAALGFGAWVFGATYFVLITLYHFGNWSAELISQHVFSPLVAGFLASTTSYLFTEWIMRAQIVPHVFPDGRLSAAPRAFALGVGARLGVLMIAVAFTPLFTMLGLFTAAEDRVATGLDIENVLAGAVSASRTMFVFYVALGSGLTLMLARSLTRPLGSMAAVLRRVQAGRLDAQVSVTSADEVGVLAEGVNAMVGTLREREHILRTFGRVVDPSVRDYLLSGRARPGGEARVATVLFADLRGFTAFAERAGPAEVVETLNRFFTTMTVWVQESGGFVNKFIGDAMLVVFGLLGAENREHAADSAARALRAALGMHARLAELNATRRAAGEGPLGISIGIHAGQVLAGTIGAEDRHEYTVVGDTVNVASRLQQLCREQERDLLVSRETYELARRAGFDGDATAVGSVTLRGRSAPVEIFALPAAFSTR
jgi:adenylate cyclase